VLKLLAPTILDLRLEILTVAGFFVEGYPLLIFLNPLLVAEGEEEE
jgi:hypothetical protein